jgi:hypothetical protein
VGRVFSGCTAVAIIEAESPKVVVSMMRGS